MEYPGWGFGSFELCLYDVRELNHGRGVDMSAWTSVGAS